jgi:catechol 2,3-dioxygenase-like lactoylglutathione lyase family enzyme
MFQTARVFGSVVVDDLATAQKFYGETLGLQVSEENGALMLHLAGHHRILVSPKPDHSPASFTILNFPVDDIDQAVDELGAGACRSGTTRASTPMTGGSAAARSVPSPGLPTLPATPCPWPRSVSEYWSDRAVQLSYQIRTARWRLTRRAMCADSTSSGRCVTLGEGGRTARVPHPEWQPSHA